MKVGVAIVERIIKILNEINCNYLDFSSDDSIIDKNYIPQSSEEDDNTSASDSNLVEESSSDDIDDDDLETTTNSNIILTNDNNWHTIENQSSSNQVPFCPEMSTYNFEISDIQSPLNAYQLFVSDEMLDIIVKETNRYAKHCLQNYKTPKSRLNLWTNTDRNEIKRFFSIVLVMGLNHLPAIMCYWSKDIIYRNDFIANAMTRDRFQLLLRYLHFCNMWVEINLIDYTKLKIF